MLTFDINKIRTEKVLLTKVTGSNVYVRRNVDGTKYENPLGTPGTHRRKDVIKVPFTGGFARDFITNNYLRDFNRAKRACLVWYENTLIHVEVERGRQSEAEGPWISNIEGTLSVLPKVLPKDTEVLYDGQYLFWHDTQDMLEQSRLDPAGRFAVMPCKCISMSNMGVIKRRHGKTNKRAAARSQAMANLRDPEVEVCDADLEAIVVTLRRSVLTFHPYAGSPDKQKRDFYACSPVLEQKTIQYGGDGEGRTQTSRDDQRALYRMGNKDHPVYVSLEFVMRAADTIGTNYGHEAVDFLDLPSMIAATGEVNFHRIDQDERKMMPAKHRAEDAIAWLMGFMHREKDLVLQRKLTGMFRHVLRQGLVQEVHMELMRKADRKDRPLPLKQFRGVERMAAPAPF